MGRTSLKYCFREQKSLVAFAYNYTHIVSRNLVNRVVGAHFSCIVLKQRNHEVKLPLARPHCPSMAAAEPAGVVPNTTPRWRAQKWSGPSRYDAINTHTGKGLRITRPGKGGQILPKNQGDRTNTSKYIHKKHEGRAELSPFSSARVKA